MPDSIEQKTAKLIAYCDKTDSMHPGPVRNARVEKVKENARKFYDECVSDGRDPDAVFAEAERLIAEAL